MENKGTIMCICAHNDDQVIGAGGALAKYAKEGYRILTLIMSFGELGIIQYQETEARKTRVKESRRADKILGFARTHYLGLTEGKFAQEIAEKNIGSKLKTIIRKEKPNRIFTHATDDPHPDHRDVNRFVLSLAKELDYKGEIYSFNIWNFFINFKNRHNPKMVVDISDTFKLKANAFGVHRSQWHARWSLTWNVYFQAIYYGLKYHMKYAEVFYRLQ